VAVEVQLQHQQLAVLVVAVVGITISVLGWLVMLVQRERLDKEILEVTQTLNTPRQVVVAEEQVVLALLQSIVRPPLVVLELQHTQLGQVLLVLVQVGITQAVEEHQKQQHKQALVVLEAEQVVLEITLLETMEQPTLEEEHHQVLRQLPYHSLVTLAVALAVQE
jgi:hypothetical protein